MYSTNTTVPSLSPILILAQGLSLGLLLAMGKHFHSLLLVKSETAV